MNSGKPSHLFVRPVLIVLLIAVNLYLTISLSRWVCVAFPLETFAAACQLLVALGYAVRDRKGPSLLQVVLWMCLVMPWFLGPLKARVLDSRIESVGTEALLEDARWLGDFIGDDHKPMEMDGENLMVPPALQALSPESVRVLDGEVIVDLWSGFGADEAIFISTDKSIVPGPLYPTEPVERHTSGAVDTYFREVAPGISWSSWSRNRF